ncbi:hypothetical protein FDUTEX481_06573 [Tolypothrix sp. PCC 7601]|nr:hypothetical protein FDUTEX481_06573 [Tolypothrix sp. PCC 7601]
MRSPKLIIIQIVSLRPSFAENYAVNDSFAYHSCYKNTRIRSDQ